jgi:hypothetical protein
MNGFYPVRNRNGSAMYCGLCPSACKTCVSNARCTLCEANAELNDVTGVCEYSNNYKTITSNKITIGQNIPNFNNSKYFFDLIQV